MPYYRIYGLTTAGHFAWVLEAVCSNDTDACSIAQAHPRPERLREVWSGPSRVALVISQGSIPAGPMRFAPEDSLAVH
jgi:hypothetical protein